LQSLRKCAHDAVELSL